MEVVTITRNSSSLLFPILCSYAKVAMLLCIIELIFNTGFWYNTNVKANYIKLEQSLYLYSWCSFHILGLKLELLQITTEQAKMCITDIGAFTCVVLDAL